MPLEYVRHWRCGECSRAGLHDFPDRVHDEQQLEAACCICGGRQDLGRVAVMVAPIPRKLPLLPDPKPIPGARPMLRVLRGGRD
jgi:hypothetical protein